MNKEIKILNDVLEVYESAKQNDYTRNIIARIKERIEVITNGKV